MTSKQLAEVVGCSQPWIFHLKKKFADRCPPNFDDVEGWKALLAFSRTQAKVEYVRGATLPRVNAEPMSELSDIARLTKARANKVETEQEILSIELAATKRQVVREEEITALFAKLAVVVRGRLMKMANDFPSMLSGLDAAAIDKVVREKLDEALSSLVIPTDFFDPRGIV